MLVINSELVSKCSDEECSIGQWSATVGLQIRGLRLVYCDGKEVPELHPNYYDRGPLPDWVSCKACNKVRYKNYPETKEHRVLPCMKKPTL